MSHSASRVSSLFHTGVCAGLLGWAWLAGTASALVLAAPASAASQLAGGDSTEFKEFVDGQAMRIASHGYFSKVAFDRFEPDPGHVLFVQKNPAAKEGEAERIVARHLEWMLEVEAQFLQNIAAPAKLERSRGGAPHVPFVLRVGATITPQFGRPSRPLAALRIL